MTTTQRAIELLERRELTPEQLRAIHARGPQNQVGRQKGGHYFNRSKDRIAAWSSGRISVNALSRLWPLGRQEERGLSRDIGKALNTPGSRIRKVVARMVSKARTNSKSSGRDYFLRSWGKVGTTKLGGLGVNSRATKYWEHRGKATPLVLSSGSTNLGISADKIRKLLK
jgi:hypothetical protein